MQDLWLVSGVGEGVGLLRSLLDTFPLVVWSPHVALEDQVLSMRFSAGQQAGKIVDPVERDLVRTSVTRSGES